MAADNRELTRFARELSLEAFGLFPDIPFFFNSRLKRVLGRLVYLKNRTDFKPVRIEVSTSIRENETLLAKTLLHELSHFYLMISKKDFSHSCEEFKKLSLELGFELKASCEGLFLYKWLCASCGKTVAVSFNKRKKSGLSACCLAPLILTAKNDDRDF